MDELVQQAKEEGRIEQDANYIDAETKKELIAKKQKKLS
jgi:hypothetical protein